MTPSKDEHYMRHALSMARRGLGRVWPNPAVGCVLVKDGHVIAAARTADGGRPHAEAVVLAAAGAEAKGATAYVSLEPCSHEGQTGPCAQKLIDAGIRRVVVACVDPDPRVSGQGIAMLEAAGLQVDKGVLDYKAKQLNAGFFKRITKWQPAVTLKMAVSADGMIAAAKGARTQISGEMAARYMHHLRSNHDAILVGIGTALADDPLLTARLPGLEHKITRCVMDTHLRLPIMSKLVQSAPDHPLYILHNANMSGRSDEVKALEEKNVKLVGLDNLTPEAVLTKLAKDGITRLMVEGGAQIATSFLEAGVVDEFHLIKSPQEIGKKGLSALHGQTLEEALQSFSLIETRPLGDDVLEIYKAKH